MGFDEEEKYAGVDAGCWYGAAVGEIYGRMYKVHD